MADPSDLVASRIEAKRRKLEAQLAKRRGGESGDLTSSASADTMSSADVMSSGDATEAHAETPSATTPPPAPATPLTTGGGPPPAAPRADPLAASSKLTAPARAPEKRAESAKLPSPLPASPGDKLAASAKLVAPGKAGPGDKLAESSTLAAPPKQPVHLSAPSAPGATVKAATPPPPSTPPPAPETDPRQTMGAILIGVGVLLCIGLLMIISNRPEPTPEPQPITEPTPPPVTEPAPPVAVTEPTETPPPVAPPTETPPPVAVTEAPPVAPTEAPPPPTTEPAPPVATTEVPPPTDYAERTNAVPALVKAEPQRQGIVVSWDAAADVDYVVRSFEVLRQVGDGAWEKVHEGVAAVGSWTDAQPQQRVDHRYKVAALATLDPENPVVRRSPAMTVPAERARMESDPTPAVRAASDTYVLPVTITFPDDAATVAPEDVKAIAFVRVYRWDPETSTFQKHTFTVQEGSPIGEVAKLRGGRSFDFTVGAVLEDARVETRKHPTLGHDEQVQVIRVLFPDGSAVEWNDKDVPPELAN